MLLGVPKEIKDNEYRVGLVPSSVAELVHRGHNVLIERGAGIGAGLADDDYRRAGGLAGRSSTDRIAFSAKPSWS